MMVVDGCLLVVWMVFCLRNEHRGSLLSGITAACLSTGWSSLLWLSYTVILFHKPSSTLKKIVASLVCLLIYFCVQNVDWLSQGFDAKSNFALPFFDSSNHTIASGEERDIFIAWISFVVYGLLRTKSPRMTCHRLLQCLCVACFEFCFMVLPLFWWYHSTNQQSITLHWFELVVFINQAVAYSSIAAWVYEDIHYHLTDSIVPFWMKIGRPFINYFVERPTEERMIQYFDPKSNKEHAFIKKMISDYYNSLVPPKTTTIWYFASQRAMHYTTYQQVNAYYEKHEQSLSHKQFKLVVILGLPRSGTTFTQHELMRRNPEWKGLRVCDLLYPLDEDKEQKAWFGVYIYKLLWGGFFKHLDLSHPYEHDSFEEETLLFRGSMRWMPTDYCNPNAEDGYIYLMKVLKLFFQDGDTIVLKSPYHALYPKLVNKYFGDGKIICLERNFEKVQPSWHKLMRTVNMLEDPYAEYPLDEYEASISERAEKQLKYMQNGTKEILDTHKNARLFKSETLFENPTEVFDSIHSFVKFD